MKFGDVSCRAQHGGFNDVVYHSASRVWLFQGIEAAVFTGMAIVLGGFAVWWVPHPHQLSVAASRVVSASCPGSPTHARTIGRIEPYRADCGRNTPPS
jgi:hypothetical protein